MSLTQSFKRLFVLLAFAASVPTMAQGPEQTAVATNIVTARIRLDDRSMIIVPVSINGSGPYDFLLDTGCAKTIVSQKLADELGLPRAGAKTVVGVLASARMSVVHVDVLSVAGATVPGGEVFSSDDTASASSRVRGVLGEDFLQNFDVLIDYRHQVIRLDAPLGSMAGDAAGEHLPIQLSGIYHGQPSRNRLIVSGHIAELGDVPMSLLLDSAANHLILFRDGLGLHSNQQETVRVGTISQSVSLSAATHTIQSLCLGRNFVSNVTAIALDRRGDVDTDGLVPISLFKSVLISSRGKFVILNPSFPKTSR